MGHRPPAPKVRYIDQVIGDETHGIDFGYFGGAFRNQEADVVHILDLNALLGESTKDSARVAEAKSFVETLQEQRTALVQTILDSTPADDAAQQILDEATETFIVLDNHTPTPDASRTVVVPHAHFRSRFFGYPRAHEVAGRLLCVARSELSRSAEGPLKVFSVTDTPGLSLRVVGDEDPALEQLIPRAVRRAGGSVSARTELLSDAELVREIDAAEYVILPQVTSLEDMTLLYLALSLDRPVMLPESELARELGAEVGPGWINCFDGPVTAEGIDQLVAQARALPRSVRPDLDARDPEVIARRYAEVYRAAAKSVTR